ncbi:TPA: hypothetical protein HA219_02745 [Candidatus Woesearchaeota archaeon]|nr:hypothetical protein [Candidatus Woesearchaeota archaeon]
MAQFDDTTLPIISKGLMHALDHDIANKNELKHSIDTLLPWIKKSNPLIHGFIQHFAFRAKKRSLDYVTDSFDVPLPKELKEAISEAASYEALIAASYLYLILDRQGHADRLKAEIEGE